MVATYGMSPSNCDCYLYCLCCAKRSPLNLVLGQSTLQTGLVQSGSLRSLDFNSGVIKVGLVKMCIKEQFRYWKFFTWSTETYTGCSGITSPPTIVWPALKLVHSTILMSGRSVSISYQSDIKKMSIIDVAGDNSTLDVVGAQRGSNRNLDISPLPWHCLHCVPRQDAQGA